MAKLTNCEISFERSVKIADYENKKFGARFSVLIEDNDDPDEITELYGQQIVHFVEAKLGIKSEIVIPPQPIKPILNSPAKVPTMDKPAISSAAAPAPATSPAADEPTQKAKRPGRPKKEAAPKPAATVDEDFPEETTAPAAGGPIVTDAQMRESIMQHVAKHKDPGEVRQLVQTFFEPASNKVFQSTEIPQDRRQEFLTKLNALGNEAAEI